MNLNHALAYARETLKIQGIEDASLEGEILLKHVTGVSRARLYSQPEVNLDSAQENALKQALERRVAGEPSAYITGHREFYGLDFIVNSSVLIPRPETELIIEKAIGLTVKQNIQTIADIGTGCGAIAVSLAVNLPRVTVYATDVSPQALEVAAQNCRKHGVAGRIKLIQGDLLKPLKDKVDMIIANLPYVSDADLQAQKELTFEPQQALRGGKDGLDVIRIFCRQATGKLNMPGYLLMEIGIEQAETVTALLADAFPRASVETDRDLAGIERIVSLRLTQA